MQTPQHSNTRCPVYLHPTAATNRAAVIAIQQTTGLLVITNVRSKAAAQLIASADTFPWGGDAA
ncbi:hypothetical protein PSJE_15595 [Pseudomonas jessenii]|uniref:Uncharacterized protein n=1 Tax=Pseudomonas jessenii TaxID=77298 RepID=A0A231GJL1_PSEJE|nr:hypothetical protein PSJE_15595 [Pseudomonas jessenii]SEB83260.1 hypothetical protein SAMN04490187_2142 [Pseudomonas jessenii]